MTRLLRYSSLSLLTIFGIATFAWVIRQEMTYLNWAFPVVGLICLVLFGIWYLVFGGMPLRQRIRRLAFVALVFLVVGILGVCLLRYEGSSSGSSFPRFSWVWEKPESMQTPVGATLTTRSGIHPDVSGPYPVNFLGPERNGMWKNPTFGTNWKSHPPELLWRRSIGKAWSSFAISGKRAITQQQVGDDEHVTCIDLFTGQDLWTHLDPKTRLLLERKENAGAAMGGDGPRATPTLHEGKVYSMGGTGIVSCLDLETGKLIWSRNLIRELGGGIQKWGMANSPLILTDQHAVVFAGPDKPGPTLITCDLLSGENLWIYEGDGASYSSPRLMTFSDTKQIVSVNATDVSGVDPATGTELWRHSWPGHFPKVGQPLAYGPEHLLLTASYGAGSLLLKITPTGGKFRVDQIWKSTRLKTKFSSAAILGDHAYGLDEGRLACIDLRTGERVWKNEKFGFGQHLLFGEWLLVQAESGDIVLGTVSPAGFVEKGRIAALSSMTWNTPAVAGRILLVRNDHEAACYLLPPTP